MAATREFDRETRERAMRMYQDRLAGSEYSKLAARRHVGGCPGPIRWIEDRHVGIRGTVEQVCDDPGLSWRHCVRRTPTCAGRTRS